MRMYQLHPAYVRTMLRVTWLVFAKRHALTLHNLHVALRLVRWCYLLTPFAVTLETYRGVAEPEDGRSRAWLHTWRHRSAYVFGIRVARWSVSHEVSGCSAKWSVDVDAADAVAVVSDVALGVSAWKAEVTP